MQITSIRYGVTKNTGNYENIKLDVEAVPSEGQTAASALEELKAYVDEQVNGKPAVKDESRNKEAEPAKEAPKKRGRPPKKQQLSDAEQSVRHALDASTLQELFDRFNEARKFAKQFSVDTWEAAFIQLSDRYKELNSPDADETLVRSLTDAFKAEYSYIQEAQQAA